MKKIFRIISIVFSVIFALLVIAAIAGYFIGKNEFKNPIESYVKVGEKIYTTVPAMMIDSSFDSLNLSGKGVKIGVLDVGFGGLRERNWTKNLKVIDYANFIDGDTVDFFIEKEGLERDHGAYSCACIGGYLRGDTIKGLAWNAEYYLAEIDDWDSENRIEETRMMNAILWLLSHDVDIITSSCGYTKFEDYKEYSPKMLDGHSSRISCFVDSVLKANPNLIFVQSMGNNGDKTWKYNIFPSDVKEVISVGAIEADSVSRCSYSSFGWEGSDFIKPDVCAYVLPPRRGTSYSAPTIAGLCAALLEHKRLTRAELISILHNSGLNAHAPNKEVGYGMPQTSRMNLRPSGFPKK